MRFIILIMTLLFIALYTGCSSTLPRIPLDLGMTVNTKDAKDYRIADICVDSIKADTARVSCRVQKEGKKINGYLDVAVVSPSGEIVFKGSINSYMHSRIGGYTITAMGFPFEFKLPLSILRNNSLRLALHKNVYEGEKFFDNGNNQAL